MRKLLFAGIIAATLIGGFGVSYASALTLTPPISEFDAQRGETIIIVAKLFNESSEPLIIRPGAISFRPQGEKGQPEFFNDASGLDLQHWISLPEVITLEPQERKSVPITIRVPTSADPGGHYAAVFWGHEPPKITGQGLGIEGRIGMLLLANLEGNVKEEIKIVEFDAVDGLLTHLPVNFVARLQNNGTVHEHPAGSLVIRNMLGRTSAVIPFNESPFVGNVLPKSVRRFELEWFKNGVTAAASEWRKEWRNFAFGRYVAELHATYGTKGEVVSAATAFWVFPWQVSGVALIILILAFVILRTLLRKYNRYIIQKYARKTMKR